MYLIEKYIYKILKKKRIDLLFNILSNKNIYITEKFFIKQINKIIKKIDINLKVSRKDDLMYAIQYKTVYILLDDLFFSSENVENDLIDFIHYDIIENKEHANYLIDLFNNENLIYYLEIINKSTFKNNLLMYIE